MSIELQNMAAAGLLPKKRSAEVFKRVTETSVVAQVAGRTDMQMDGNTFLIDAGTVEADIVREGNAKPVDSFNLGLIETVPLKAAVIVDWTKEARLSNPSGIMDRIQEKMAEAINHQIDAAVLYGVSVKSKAQVPNLTYLNQTTNRVELGKSTKANGGLRGDIISGYNLVTDAGHDFTSFVADPRARSLFAAATDTVGRPLFDTATPLGGTSANIMGLPAAFGKTVSGRYGRDNPDTGVRLFGGDFRNNLKFGFIENINFKMTDTASVDGVSMWQTNREAALVEAIFSFVIRDVNAFTAYEVDLEPDAAPEA